MTDTEQEAIERAWLSHKAATEKQVSSGLLPRRRDDFTAGYLAHQQAVAGEREHLEEAARLLFSWLECEELACGKAVGAKSGPWLERERLRRSKQEGSG